MTDSILLSDSADAEVVAAVTTLDGWQFERVPSDDLLDAVGTRQNVRAVLISTPNPSTARHVTECAHSRGIPVIVPSATMARVAARSSSARRNGTGVPATSDEIAARIDRQSRAREQLQPGSSSA